MAIAQTATATQAANTSNPITMAFDCNGGNLLVVGLITRNMSREGAVPTYNGVNMTDSGQGVISSGSEARCELFFLVNPAAGSNTLSIPNTTSTVTVPIASAWSGVDTSDPFDIANSDAAGSGNTPSVTITTSASGKLIIDVMASGRGDPLVANSHILISSQDNGSFDSNAQYTLDDGSSGITLDYTLAGGGDDWAMIVAAFNPTGVPAGNIEAIGGVDWGTNVGKVGGVSKANIGKITDVDAQ